MKADLMRALEAHFPWIAKDVVEDRQIGDFELLVKLSNGETWLYDDFGNILHRFPDNENALTEEDYRHEFGRKLYRIMSRENVTQADLSRMTGLRQCQISNYVRGRTTPSFYNVHKIARALGCSVDDLSFKGL